MFSKMKRILLYRSTVLELVLSTVILFLQSTLDALMYFWDPVL